MQLRHRHHLIHGHTQVGSVNFRQQIRVRDGHPPTFDRIENRPCMLLGIEFELVLRCCTTADRRHWCLLERRSDLAHSVIVGDCTQICDRVHSRRDGLVILLW